MSKTVFIEGMSCGHCAAHVEQALRGIGLTASVDLKKKTATITAGEASDDAIKQAVADEGYEVTKVV